MDQGAPHQAETLRLAGLAASNGPWLAARLRRLAEMSGLTLPPEVVADAVEQCSLTLRRIVKLEGRPAFAADPSGDPAAELGRQQAEAHRLAGLDLPGSLRVLRLMRRCFDDLIRESWMDDKLSRARAHEDVEHVFERTLLGLYMAWADCSASSEAAAAPEDDGAGRLTEQLARRESELRRALETAHKAAGLLRQERARSRLLEDELVRLGRGGEAGPQEADPRPARGREQIGQPLAAFLEVTGEHLAAVDSAGRFEVWSPGFPAVFGLAPAELEQGLDALLPRMAAVLAEPGAFVARLRALMASQAQESAPLVLALLSGGALSLRTRILRDTKHPGEGRSRLRLLVLRDVSLEQDALLLLEELERATRLDCVRTGGEGAGPAPLPVWSLDVVGAVRQAVDIYALEHGLLRPTPGAALDLAAAVRQAVALAAPLAAERGVALDLTTDNPRVPEGFSLPCGGDRRLVQGLVLHLLRDALAAAGTLGPGARVVLTLVGGGTQPTLAVTSPREVPRAAQGGFFDKPGPGGGDLSAAAYPGIAQARYAARLLAQALGGSLAVSAVPGRGTAIVLRLPSA